MKRLITVITLLTLSLSTQALGKKSIEGEYSGKKKISLTYTGYYRIDCGKFLCFDYEDYYGKSKTLNIKLDVQITKSSTGRITVLLKSQDRKKCAGFAMSFIGEEDGFGGYDLYRNKKDYLQNLNIGTLTYQKGKVNISIPENMTQKTKGTNNYTCTWNLDYGLDLKVK